MKHNLPSGYRIRPATLDDLDATTNMLNTWSTQLMGVDKFKPAEIRREWQTPGFDMSRDTRLVAGPDEHILGYFEVWDLNPPHVRAYCWGQLRPEQSATVIGPALLNWVEERARQAIPMAPPKTRVTLLGSALTIDETTQRLYQQAGLKLIRHSLRMVINLNGQTPMPVLPAGITMRTFNPGRDERAVVHAVRDAFKDHWGYVESPFEDEYERWIHFIDNYEDFDPSLWLLAMDGDKIAGVALCEPKVEDDPDMGWVGTLGVRRPWRRRGLALALLHHVFQVFHQREKPRVGLGVDAGSLTGATRLYQKAGMQSDPTRQFDLYEKELRPGIELSTQSVGNT